MQILGIWMLIVIYFIVLLIWDFDTANMAITFIFAGLIIERIDKAFMRWLLKHTPPDIDE